MKPSAIRRSVASALAFTLIFGVSVISNGYLKVEGARALTVADCAQTVGNASNLTVTVVGNDCVLTFTGDTTWTIPAGISNVRMLLVGGGAAGQADGGSGVVIIRYTDSIAPTLNSISISSPASGGFFKLNDYISVTDNFSVKR